MTDDSLDALDARLATAERELGVHRLLQRYAAACDASDAHGVAELFAPDGAVVVRGAEYVGPALVAFYVDRLRMPTWHAVSGITVGERDDGLLDVTSGFLAIELHVDATAGVIGRYDDVVRSELGRESFVRRTITPLRRFSIG